MTARSDANFTGSPAEAPDARRPGPSNLMSSSNHPQSHHAKRASRGAAPRVYQIKLNLLEARPPIWRRLLVPGDVPLPVLHNIIQITMGWENEHLHSFIVDRVHYAPLEESWEGAPHMQDEATFTLERLAGPRRKRFLYEYDYGDRWLHELLIEARKPAAPGQDAPVCLEGEGDCPPEDCGGIFAFNELKAQLERAGPPRTSETEHYYQEMPMPVPFRLEQVNRALHDYWASYLKKH